MVKRQLDTDSEETAARPIKSENAPEWSAVIGQRRGLSVCIDMPAGKPSEEAGLFGGVGGGSESGAVHPC